MYLQKFKCNELINRIRVEKEILMSQTLHENLRQKYISMTSSLKLIQELSYIIHCSPRRKS